MPEPLVFTANYTWPDVDWSLLKRSAERVGVDIQTYGDGKGWPGYGVGKLVGPLEFLRGRTEEVVLYTDSQDSFLVHDAETILNGWMRCGAPQVLLQAEKNCYPEPTWEPEYPRNDSSWRYICAGGWMGTRTSVIAALEEIISGDQFKENSHCDQRCWTDWYLRHPSGKLRATLDTNCEVFQSFFTETEVANDGRNLITGTRPSIFHFNGRTHGEREWYKRITGDEPPNVS